LSQKESTPNAQRHLLDSPHRSTMAGFARAIWALAERLRLLSKLAKQQDLQSDSSSPANPSRLRGQDRLGFMVHRWLIRACLSGSSWGFKKSPHLGEPFLEAGGACGLGSSAPILSANLSKQSDSSYDVVEKQKQKSWTLRDDCNGSQKSRPVSISHTDFFS
jgi:hypothetical protein